MLEGWVMTWIAGVFPVLSFVLPLILYYRWKTVWLSTCAVLFGSLAALWAWFSLTFWPWVLAYVMLAWLGCWAGAWLRKQRPPRGEADRRADADGR
ncbi:hypothetical protein [Alicyclobacillus macrosporangiidus]|uniref:Uncharacterized protein n=1 Tax=Alicyclobacillus macrosporangiidus TaxID=392015 RepID=A0A1I7FPA8_9BACL|nr:hypothetical protein [Alicyclobacillus macrosporangiidus]SFU37985.1 hypothetical protein SAMN05421543_101373 [Alicyclobacillus macrosporangiidus]